MLPDDPNQKPGDDPEETKPDLPAPDYSTRRIETEESEPRTPPAPERSSYATRKLEPDQPEVDANATHRIDPEQLFAALEPEPELPPPAEPTRIIDEPSSNEAATIFNLPDTPTQAEIPQTPKSDLPLPGGFDLPPASEPPRSGGFSLPPQAEPPAAAPVPPAAKKSNTGIWIAAIVGVVLLVMCCLCVGTVLALVTVFSSGTTGY